MIASMERIEFLCVLDTARAVVAFLQEYGVVHVEEVPLAVEEAPGLLRRVHLKDEEKAEIEQLEELHRILREIAPLLVRKADASQTESAAAALLELPQEDWRRKARRWSRELRSLTRRKVNINDNAELIRDYQKMLRSLRPVLGERDVVLGQGARVVILKGEVGQAGPQLDARLKRKAGEACEFLYDRTGRNRLVGLVLYPEEKDQDVEQVLRDEGIARLDMPERMFRGRSFREVLSRVDDNLRQCRQALEEIDADIVRFSDETGAELRAMLMAVSDRLGQLHVMELLAATEMVAVIHGWVPATELPGLESALGERFPGEAYLGRLPLDKIDRKRIPILLRNPGPLEPFEVLLALLKPPTYGGIDPSALVGIFFVFFYGFILGDIAYGLAVVALAMLVRHFWGRNPLVRAATAVATYAGLSAIAFGIFFGEFCGNLGERYFGMRPLWFHRGHDIITFLMAALVIGAGHIILSLSLAAWVAFRRGHVRHALERLGLLAGLCAVGTLVMGFLSPSIQIPMMAAAGVLFIACLGLLIYAARGMAFIHLFEVISLVSNVLSYSRLMALGIASVALADVANRLAGMASNLVVGVLVALSIHLLNLAIGIFSPTLHALRLNYVEFLPKFYVPEGKAYRPFKKEIML